MIKHSGSLALVSASLMMAASVALAAFNTTSTPSITPAATIVAAPSVAHGDTASPAPAQAQAPASGYVGADTCIVCHENYDRTISASKHGFAGNARTPVSQQGCESCHGPGEAHASDPTSVKPIQLARVAASTANAQCLSCHTRSQHALWPGSAHENRNVACRDCHSVHSSQGPSLLKAKTELQTCATCHRSVTNRQHRYNHMPVREGAMSCSSCHNVHGSANVKLLRAGNTVDQSCTSCHTEKRGPFLWEHAPVVDSCTTCHDSHGSNNERMLQARLPFLCQRCHVTSRHPPTIYEGFTLQTSQNANKIFGKGCANCHQQVHGSNHPNGKFFLR